LSTGPSPLFVDLSTDTGSFNITVKGSNGGDTVILGDHSGKVVTGAGGDFVDASSGGNNVNTGTGNDYIVSGGAASSAIADAAAAAGGGGNHFVFQKGSGKDVIEGFQIGKDVIKLRGYDKFDNAKDVIKHAQQDGDNVIIKLGGGNKITLLNVDLKDLKKHPGDSFDV
jgi:Ca2+-binding RTX toxin-like protein